MLPARPVLLLTGQDGPQVCFPIALSQPVQAEEFLACLGSEGDGFAPALDLDPGPGQQRQQGLQVRRAALQSGVNGLPELLPLGGLGLLLQPLVIGQAAPLGVLNDGQPVLQADQITQPPHRHGRAAEVPELALAVQGGGVPDDVIVDVAAVGVGGDDESVPAFQEPLRELIADAVGLLRRDLAGLEGLAHLIGDHIIFLVPPGNGPVLPLGKQELRVHGGRVTGEGGNQLAALGFLRVLGVAGAVGEALGDGSALVDVHGDDACSRYDLSPLKKEKRPRRAASLSAQFVCYPYTRSWMA